MLLSSQLVLSEGSPIGLGCRVVYLPGRAGGNRSIFQGRKFRAHPLCVMARSMADIAGSSRWGVLLAVSVDRR